MGKRLTKNLEININLNRNLAKKFDMEGSAIWEDEGPRPREFTIEIDSSMSFGMICNLIINLYFFVQPFLTKRFYNRDTLPNSTRLSTSNMINIVLQVIVD